MQLAHADPNVSKRLQHEVDKMEQHYHNLGHDRQLSGEKSLKSKMNLQQGFLCLKNLVILLEECQMKTIKKMKETTLTKKKMKESTMKMTTAMTTAMTKEDGEKQHLSRQNSRKRKGEKKNGMTMTTIKTLDEDWPYQDEEDVGEKKQQSQQSQSQLQSQLQQRTKERHNTGPLGVPKYQDIAPVLAQLNILTKSIMSGLNQNERHAYQHHHTKEVTHFMSGAAALHRATYQGLVQKISKGNYRVAVGLTPDQEIFMEKVIEKTGLKSHHKNITSNIMVRLFSFFFSCSVFFFFFFSFFSFFSSLLRLAAILIFFTFFTTFFTLFFFFW